VFWDWHSKLLAKNVSTKAQGKRFQAMLPDLLAFRGFSGLGVCPSGWCCPPFWGVLHNGMLWVVWWFLETGEQFVLEPVSGTPYYYYAAVAAASAIALLVALSLFNC